MISVDTLHLTIFVLKEFIDKCKNKNYSLDLIIRLKILNILYLSKLEKPSEEETKIIIKALD